MASFTQNYIQLEQQYCSISQGVRNFQWSHLLRIIFNLSNNIAPSPRESGTSNVLIYSELYSIGATILLHLPGSQGLPMFSFTQNYIQLEQQYCSISQGVRNFQWSHLLRIIFNWSNNIAPSPRESVTSNGFIYSELYSIGATILLHLPGSQELPMASFTQKYIQLEQQYCSISQGVRNFQWPHLLRIIFNWSNNIAPSPRESVTSNGFIYSELY